MDPVTLIVSALVTGAASAAQDTASNVVKDAYSGLKTLLQRRFQGKPAAETVLAKAETDPDTWEKPLAKAVAEHGSDEEVLALAQQLLQLLQVQQPVSSPKFSIRMDNVLGPIFEPHGPVTQHFGLSHTELENKD